MDRESQKNSFNSVRVPADSKKTAGMLALDLDGTLLTDSKQLTDRTVLAVTHAMEAGMHIVPVTGRPMSGIPEALLAIAGIRYIISSNGAVTSDRLTGEKIRMACLDSETASGIAEIPVSRGLIHSVFIDGAGYCEASFYDMQWDFFRDKHAASYVRKSRRITGNLQETIRHSDGRIENIWIMAGDSAERDEIDRMIRGRWPVQTVLTAARDVEVGSPEADKGKALTHLAARLGIRREEIIAFGDNENDLGMFCAAGTAVAMANASETVRQAAHCVTDSNEEDGVAKGIEALLRYGAIPIAGGEK